MTRRAVGTLDVGWALAWIAETTRDVAERRVELNELDRLVGDGDHGENLNRGFTAVQAKFEAVEQPAHVGDVLKIVATTLMSTVGGAAGPLFGTAFLRAAKVTAVEELDAEAVVALIGAALEGIVARGKATTGEKTMVDAWSPALDAARAAAASGAAPATVLAAAAEGAQLGSDATIPLRASKGRASYLCERSMGHRDPGAESSALILAAAARTAQG